MLEFVLPEERNRADVLDFYREFEESGGSCIGFGNRDNYDLRLQGMRNRKPLRICRRASCGRTSTCAARGKEWWACSA